MVTRMVNQYSDRGNIKDLANKHEAEIGISKCEMRLKSLYEYAKLNNNNLMLNSLGFITTNYIDDKNALPLTVYRIRKIVEEIKSKSGNNIALLKKQFDDCFSYEISKMASDYISNRQIIKRAMITKRPVFRRVSK
ncbi:hypothetical protein UFOVP1290_585 [uncultured Caudovirales phage]|uniref:Uncharacterized protein n=1 Tax=uncultured Caudovirales phage TaxID=2100421 RepID=A0A6J5RXW3_9CAUD|nr:hypothetical protein UFOVP1290_585 [uncultured Caudovirales phage]